MTAEQTPSNAGPRARFAGILGFQTGEGRPLASMVGLNFAVSAAFVLVQTSAFALFIEAYGSHALPYAYFSIAILTSLIAYLYLQLSQRVAFGTGLYIDLAFLAAVCFIFWLGLRSGMARWFIFLLPFWFQTLVGLANIVVWHLAGHMFNVRQAKRLFSLIVAGNWIANIVGGVVVGSFLALLPPADLYLLAGIAIVISAFVLRGGLAQLPAAAVDSASMPVRSARGGAAAALRHPYSRLIFAYTVLWWLTFFILENIFFHEVEGSLRSSAELGAFLGRQLAVMGVIALVTTSLLTSRVVNRYGLRVGLLLMPVVVTFNVLLLTLGASLGAGEAFRFWTITAARTLNIALGFSVSLSVGGLLFQPLLGSLRTSTQTIAEGIMQPLAIGLAGALLLVFNTLLDFDAVQLSYVFLIVAVPWFWSIYELSRRYPLQMSEALQRRGLGENSTLLFDDAALLQLRAALRQPRQGLALYALGQLEQIAPTDWPGILVEELPGLMSHPDPQVRLESLRRVLSIRALSALPILRRALDEETEPRVRGMLLRVLGFMQDAQSMDRVAAALDDPDLVVGSGAIIGLLAGGAGSNTKAAAVLASLVGSSDSAGRLAACEILHEIQSSEAKPHLLRLIADPVLAVRQAALRSAEHHPEPEVLRAVIAACDDPRTARAAERTLAAIGGDSLDAIAAEFLPGPIAGAYAPRLISLARVLSRIPGAKSTAMLVPMIAVPDPPLRLQVLQSLSRLGYHTRQAEEILPHVRMEVSHAASLLDATETLQNGGEPATEPILTRALDIAFRETRSRILLMLSLLYDAKAISRARLALERASTIHSAMAQETIDALLPAALKPIILPLIDDSSSASRLSRWAALGFARPGRSAADVLLALAGRSGDIWNPAWTRMCAMHAAALARERAVLPALEQALRDADPNVAREAAWSAAALSGPSSLSGEPDMLSIVEKVLILKSAPLFAETPDNVLADVANLVKEVTFSPDQVIFNKGEPGESLYIIVGGAVKVWDGDRLLNELGEGDVFGELALLDPEPRLATVKAAAPTSLLRLDAPHFREVLDSQPEVSSAIIRVVTRYLRTQLEYAREANSRLRALDSFGASPQPAPG